MKQEGNVRASPNGDEGWRIGHYLPNIENKLILSIIDLPFHASLSSEGAEPLPSAKVEAISRIGADGNESMHMRHIDLRGGVTWVW